MSTNELDNSTTATEAPVPVDTGQEPMVPLGMGDFEGESSLDPLAGADEGSRINTGTLLLGAVILVAVVGLFLMRKFSQVTLATGDSGEIERTVEAFINMVNGSEGGAGVSASLADGDSVLTVISEEYSERHVPWKDVQRNPFILFSELVQSPTQVETPDPDDDRKEWELQRGERQALFERAAERLELKSVLMGSVPLANLNNRIVRVGESITVEPEHVTFHIDALDMNSVTLVARDEQFNLIVEVVIAVDREP